MKYIHCNNLISHNYFTIQKNYNHLTLTLNELNFNMLPANAFIFPQTNKIVYLCPLFFTTIILIDLSAKHTCYCTTEHANSVPQSMLTLIEIEIKAVYIYSQTSSCGHLVQEGTSKLSTGTYRLQGCRLLYYISCSD